MRSFAELKRQHIYVGSEQGLGKALALYFSRHGSCVILSARNEAALRVRIRLYCPGGVCWLLRNSSRNRVLQLIEPVQGVARRCRRSASTMARLPPLLFQLIFVLGP